MRNRSVQWVAGSLAAAAVLAVLAVLIAAGIGVLPEHSGIAALVAICVGSVGTVAGVFLQAARRQRARGEVGSAYGYTRGAGW